MHQLVEGMLQQLTTMPGAFVGIKLWIDTEVPHRIDRSKSRTPIRECEHSKPNRRALGLTLRDQFSAIAAFCFGSYAGLRSHSVSVRWIVLHW
jgi:hypothetical protein